ncbi:hypothetical protein M885DRAFT_561303 [Pelagophyceae sp. CCMP2097]|nr:hypothetical protein M885DRAFT_561303 [Pelagophyceae sp. CCMP2097]
MAAQRAFEQLRSRCVAHHALLLKDSPMRGRGLFIGDAMAKGTVVAAIDRRIWKEFSADAARIAAPRQLLERLDTIDMQSGAGGMLAAATLTALNVLSLSDRRYMDLVPDNFDAPAMWSDEALAALQTSPVAKRARGFEALCDHIYAACHLQINPGIFQMLMAMTRSRAVSENTTKFFSLVPLVELFNHDFEPNCLREFDGDTFTVVATRDVAAGEELTLSYGNMSNGDLLNVYGFALTENPHNSLALALEPEDVETQSPRADAVGAAAAAVPDVLMHDSPLAPHCLRRLRAAHALTEDVVAAQASGNDDVDFGLPLSARNEREAVDALVLVVKRTLAAYKTTPGEDAALLANEQLHLEAWERAAILVRLGEKQLLMQQLDRADQALALLN